MLRLSPVQMEVSTVTVRRRVVATTDLRTFVSRRGLKGGECRILQEIRAPELILERRLGLLCSSSGYIPVAARRLLTLLRHEAAAFLDDPGR